MDISSIQAVIFDNDGVIVNSEPLSCGALRDLFRQSFDIDIGTDFSAVIGTSDSFAIQHYAEMNSIELENWQMKELIRKKQELYLKKAGDKLTTFEGFEEFLTRLSSHKIIGVASSGNFEKIKFSLSQVGLSSYFPHISSAEEVERGKPAPDLFLKSAEKMGVSPGNCAVIEDSVKGIEAAKSAGMLAIGFTSTFTDTKLTQAGADLCVNSFHDLDMLFHGKD